MNRLIFVLILFSKLNAQTTTDIEIDCYKNLFNDSIQHYLVGEWYHEDIPTQKLKIELLKFAIEDKKINQLVFESDLAECYFVGKTIKNNSSNNAIQTIFPVWHSKEMKQMFSDLSKFDFQFIGMDIRPKSYYFHWWLLEELKKQNCPLEKEFGKIDSFVIENGLKMTKINEVEQLKYKDYYQKLINFLNENKSHLDDIDYIIAVKEIQNRISLTECMIQKNGMDFRRKRDEFMAENILWIDSTFNKKMFIWAHNGHNSYDEDKNYKPMGAYLPKTFRAKSLNIAVGKLLKTPKGFSESKFGNKYTIINLNQLEGELQLVKVNANFANKTSKKEFEKIIIINK